MKQTRFLLIGCGTIGQRHAALAAEKGELVAVCDIDEKKVKLFSKQYNCYGYTSLTDLLMNEEADAMVIQHLRMRFRTPGSAASQPQKFEMTLARKICFSL
jgi:UDP-glucose 6-dehydrogenase